MRNSALLLAFLLLASLVNAQSATLDFKYGFKLSNQSSFNFARIRDSNGDVIGGGNVEIFHPVPAFVMRGNKGNFWDFSLQNINLGFSDRQTGTTPQFRPYHLGLSVKAGFFYTFAKPKAQHWLPMLGLEINPYVGASKSRLIESVPGLAITPYMTSYQTSGVTAYLTPRLMWLPGKRLFMDASVSIPLLSVDYFNVKSSDPGAVNYGSSVNAKVFGLQQTVQASIGIGFKL